MLLSAGNSKAAQRGWGPAMKGLLVRVDKLGGALVPALTRLCICGLVVCAAHHCPLPSAQDLVDALHQFPLLISSNSTDADLQDSSSVIMARTTMTELTAADKGTNHGC